VLKVAKQTRVKDGLAASCDVKFELTDQLTSAQQVRSYEREKVSLTHVSADASVSCHIL